MDIKMHPFNSMLKDAGYTIQEEEELYDNQLQDIIENPRKYLDSLEYMRTYKVRWHTYKKTKKGHNILVTPYRFVKNDIPL